MRYNGLEWGMKDNHNTLVFNGDVIYVYTGFYNQQHDVGKGKCIKSRVVI